MFKSSSDNNGFYIQFYKSHFRYITDRGIAQQLKMELQDYINILLKFNATEIEPAFCYFTNEKDCEKCCAYLEEAYLPILKLIGG